MGVGRERSTLYDGRVKRPFDNVVRPVSSEVIALAIASDAIHRRRRHYAVGYFVFEI